MNSQSISSIILLAALSWTTACGDGSSVENNSHEPERIPVQVVAVQRDMYAPGIVATGLISTTQEANYAFILGGVIESIHVDQGERFTKGQLLARLRTTEIDAGVTQARYSLEKAERDLLRVSNLHADSVATLEQLENSRTAYDVARQQLDALLFNRQYTSIHAASDGFVSRKLANEGEVVAGGMPVLAINGTGGAANWTLQVGLSDLDWARVRVGQGAEVTMDAFPGRTFVATVSRKAQSAEPGSGSFLAELLLHTEDIEPAVGMYARALIATTDSMRLFRIPYDALIEADGNKAFVFVPSAEAGKVDKLPVTVAGFDNGEVRIAAGLEQVKQVITANSAFLNSSSTILIQN